MSARKGATRRRKFKKWGLKVWSFAKGYLSFSKLLVYAVLYIDYKSTMTTLDLCRIAVANNYTGSLPYLTALIAFLQAATATVLSFSLNKSIKSIVTLLLSGVFAYLAITGQTSQEFMTVYTVVIAFYFGTQTQKISDAVDKSSKGE